MSASSAFIRVPFSSIVAAGPTYNRLTWNFTHGDGFINEADAAIMYPTR